MKEGWFVAIHHEPAYPGAIGCVVGQIQQVDERGIRITHIDWLTGDCTGMDHWIPWSGIREMVVATDQHHPQTFDWAAEQSRNTKGWRGDS